MRCGGESLFSSNSIRVSPDKGTFPPFFSSPLFRLFRIPLVSIFLHAFPRTSLSPGEVHRVFLDLTFLSFCSPSFLLSLSKFFPTLSSHFIPPGLRASPPSPSPQFRIQCLLSADSVPSVIFHRLRTQCINSARNLIHSIAAWRGSAPCSLPANEQWTSSFLSFCQFLCLHYQ